MSFNEIIDELPKLSPAQRWKLELCLRELDQDVVLCDSIAVEGAVLLSQMEAEDERRDPPRKKKRRLVR
jgi:hypothetical protein